MLCQQLTHNTIRYGLHICINIKYRKKFVFFFYSNSYKINYRDEVKDVHTYDENIEEEKFVDDDEEKNKINKFHFNEISME